MKQIHQYEEVLSFLNKSDKALVYVMTTNCSVCHADYPKVELIVNETNVPAIYFLADKIPEASGQLSLFTSPVVILYKSEREYHRQARIINFDTLRLRIDQLMQE